MFAETDGDTDSVSLMLQVYVPKRHLRGTECFYHVATACPDTAET